MCMSYRWWSCCRTDAGRQRHVNEDAYLDLDSIGLWVVADGMGGHARGDVASRLIVEAFDDLRRPESMDAFTRSVRQRLGQVNRRMRAETAGGAAQQRMGSTVVAFLVYKREWNCLWAGDSRAYLMREGRLYQITRDHSVAQEMFERGELRQDEVADHPLANRITRAIGARDDLVLDEYRSFLRDGDTVLLCSDGLNKEVDDAELADILENYDCDEASRELVDLTLERGARDNVTVAVIRFEAITDFRARLSDDDTAVNHDLHRAAVQQACRRREIDRAGHRYRERV
jgi:serine/threonine protein phosphatase PrpC